MAQVIGLQLYDDDMEGRERDTGDPGCPRPACLPACLPAAAGMAGLASERYLACLASKECVPFLLWQLFAQSRILSKPDAGNA